MATISKAEFDNLPDALKAEFQADGDNYSLVREDVEGLKKSKAQILEEKKRLADELAELQKFKADYEAQTAAADEEKLKAAGAFKELEEKLRAKLTETETKAAEREAAILNNFKVERLKNELQARGVLPDRSKYALADIADQVDLVSDDNGFSLKVKSGIGDAKEFDALVEGLKTSSPFLFAPNGATGGGASGSYGNGGGALKRSEMTDKQKSEYISKNGQKAYLSLPN